jgi:FAD/FMN-containing dehydrogenase
MADLSVVTLEGKETNLRESTVEDLSRSLRGKLLCRDDEGYDEARRVWNGLIDKRPAMIARCEGVSDVIAAVKFARSANVQVSVRGGGHNVTGNAVFEGGLMIALSPM